MSSENTLAEVDPEEVTNGQLLEYMRGLEARNEMLETQLDEVQRENDELRDLVEKTNENAVTKTAANHIIGSILGNEIQNYQADIFQHKDAAEDFQGRFGDLEHTVKRHESVIEEEGTATGDTKEQAWKAVIDQAENLSAHKEHKLPKNRVLLYSKEIQTATGYSNRRACQLIEEWGEEKEGADWRPYKRRNNDIQKKALKINLNIWGDEQ